MSVAFSITKKDFVFLQFKALVILANLLTNADSRSQFWHQSDLIQSLADVITASAKCAILAEMLIWMLNSRSFPFRQKLRHPFSAVLYWWL